MEKTFVFVLEYFVYYEGGGIIGVFATEEDARTAFWKKVVTGEAYSGDGVTITRREVGKVDCIFHEYEYEVVAEFQENFRRNEWVEVTNDA